MLIKNLTLINFQAHANLHLDFVDGVNVISGVSSVGKTCIKHAIEFLCLHDTFNGQRKIGTKTTSVKGEFSNGIIVERIISNSINRYILTKDGKESIFDSVGKTAPSEIKEAIGIYPLEVDGEELYLNSQSQCALPFLLDKSPSFRMKLFNKLTGNDVLDKLFGQFNKDILRIKRDYKEEVQRFENHTVDLKTKEIEKEKAEAIHIRVKTRLESLKKTYEKYSKLLELKTLLETNEQNMEEIKLKLNNLRFPQPEQIQRLKEIINRFETLKTVKSAIEKLQASLTRVRGQLKDLKLPELDFATLCGKIEWFGNLNSIKNRLEVNLQASNKAKRDIKIVQMDTIHCIETYKKLLIELKVCPICKGNITDECLKEINL